MSKTKILIQDADLAVAEAVLLLRAAARAREIAAETHTPLIAWECRPSCRRANDRGDRKARLK